MSEDDWVPVRTCNTAQDALVVKALLAGAGIDARVPAEHSMTAQGLPPAVYVRRGDIEAADHYLNAPEEATAADHPGAIRRYREWAAHRYDPGHYLGGTIEPHLRIGELGGRARRLAAWFLGVSACLSVAAAVRWSVADAGGVTWAIAPEVAWAALLAAAAWRMWRR